MCVGVCLGLQCAVIEFARNVLGWEGAHSTEAEPATPHPVVIEMPEHHPGQLGGTMRLGKRKTIFRKGHDSVLRKYTIITWNLSLAVSFKKAHYHHTG